MSQSNSIYIFIATNLLFYDTLTSVDIPHGVTAWYTFSTDQSATSQPNIEVIKPIYFRFDFRIVPTVWYFVQFIAYNKINESLPDETSWGMSSDVSVPLKKREIQQIYIILLD